MSLLFHGGDLQTASIIYGRNPDDWLDLSTGINQYSYPIPPIAAAAWQRLPYLNPQLTDAAAGYYGQHHCLASSGSQPIIELLPAVLPKLGSQKPTWLPDIGYQEHKKAWSNDASIQTYDGLSSLNATQQINAALEQGKLGHLIIINPNNPTAERFGIDQLYQWSQRLAAHNGYVVIDEAFIDTHPIASVLTQRLADNMVVLRSVGKFFGLAGMRLGFTFAEAPILDQLSIKIGPWSVNGPAQMVAIAALEDEQWQAQMRQQLTTEQPLQLALWHKLMADKGATLAANHELFRSFVMPTKLAHHLHQSAAKNGILLRPVDINSSTSLLRFGNIDLNQSDARKRCQTWLQQEFQ